MALHVAGQSLSKIAVQFEIGKGTVHAIVKQVREGCGAGTGTYHASEAPKGH